MKSAVKEMEATSARVESMIPPNYKVEEMEGAILTTLDSLSNPDERRRYPGGQLRSERRMKSPFPSP